MIVKHVLIGGFFTLVGLVSLLVPAIPFICIGALILGPIELLVGLTANKGPGKLTLPSVANLPPVRLPAGAPNDPPAPTIRVATRKEFSRVYAVVAVDGPSQHEITAGYEGETATVLLDGNVYAQFGRPLGGKAGTDIDVPLPDDPRSKITVRFWGWRPHVTVFYNDQSIGNI